MQKMKTEIITSLQNTRVKQAVRLRDRGPRDKSDLFLIEGYRELLRAVDASRAIETLFICPDLFLGENEESLIKRVAAKGGVVYTCTKEVFHKISYRDRPDGLLAIAPQHHGKLEDLKFKNVPLLIVAEAIEKPGNLGTILRSSDAAGCNGVIVCDRCTDVHNPNVVRASVGTLFTLPVIEASSEASLKWLKAQGICILAATPSAEKDFTEVDMTVPLAIAVGTEQLGLTDLWMKQADIQVRIPMYGVADSLNVATATTLLLYEAQRQRKQ
jgi:TrmH family RNA methyltransferase